MATTGHDPRHGHEYVVDLADMTRSLITAGAVERSWERREAPALRGVGLFEADRYDPGTWKPDSPAYVPFLTADRIDKLWGSKILMRFTREQIRAVVETARLSDPKAVDYITDTLVARQRATARYWFERTSPLDHFAVGPTGMCFDDLALVYDLADPETSYTARSFARDGRPILAPVAVGAARGGHTCMPLAVANTSDRYTIVEIITRRTGFTGSIFVHVARDPATDSPRVIGIWRL
jgi:hypothetical protein